VAVLGDDPELAARLVRAARLHPELGLSAVAVIQRHRSADRVIEGLRVVHGPVAVDRLSRRIGIRCVIGLTPGADRPTLYHIDTAGAHFAKLSQCRRLAPLIGIRPMTLTNLNAYARAKRSLDLLATLAGMSVFGPLMILIALLIRLDTRGPAMFLQKRPGQKGKPFRILKFRTMVVGAARMRKSLNAESQQELETFGKIRRDPRVTRVGALLRRTSLDELPQLINVLRGEMSLVGPRPHLMFQRAWLVAHEGDALRAVPGLTGIWQISGRSSIPFEMRCAMDAYYAQVASLWLDLYILARTVTVVLKGKGAY
jgi:lipopolysaccharide/colanic/teichoic acid biosynthesis glycosyltransferase